MSGHFHRCDFCGLDDEQRALLRVFLATRGNVKEIERYLGVSYPTARSRLDDLIAAVGANGSGAERKAAPRERRDILDQVAAGRLDVGTALGLLARPG